MKKVHKIFRAQKSQEKFFILYAASIRRHGGLNEKDDN